MGAKDLFVCSTSQEITILQYTVHVSDSSRYKIAAVDIRIKCFLLIPRSCKASIVIYCIVRCETHAEPAIYAECQLLIGCAKR